MTADFMASPNKRLQAALNDALRQLGEADANNQALVALGRALLVAIDLKHGSMCPANTCTCDLTETVAIMAASFRYALDAASPEEPEA